MEEKTFMEEMREKYYPYHKQSKNLQEALEQIKEEMQRGGPCIEFWTYWTDLPDDWVVETETLDKLVEMGFTVKRRGDEFGDHTYIVSWDKYDECPNEVEYGKF